jgi:2-oxoisovalerate dehydrogenase E1 component alpha subunit
MPDFSRLRIPPAGSVPRPDSSAPAASLRNMAYDMIRVLTDEGEAVGDWVPSIAPETLRDG